MSKKILILLAAAATAVAGCGTKTISKSSEENLVRLGIARVNAGTAKTINCPSNVEAKVGKTFDCHFVLTSGLKGTFTLRVDRVQGSSGHMTIVAAHQG